MLVKVASAKIIFVDRVFLTQSTLALNVKYQFAISAQRLKMQCGLHLFFFELPLSSTWHVKINIAFGRRMCRLAAFAMFIYYS